MTTSGEILAFLDDRIIEAVIFDRVRVDGPTALHPGRGGYLSFTTEGATTSQSSLIIGPRPSKHPSQLWLAVENPRREFARVAQQFFPPGEPILQVSTDVSIGAGTVIGYTGFGYEREDDGTPLLIPHYGGVTIGNRVEIGANSCIDRGTLEDTVIEDDVKIDNLVHIAHNCHVGQGAFVIAGAILCGGVTIGARAWIGAGAMVREHLTVGADAVVGLGAVVVKDVPAGATVVGNPARIL